MIFALFWHNVHINDTRNYVVNRKGVGNRALEYIGTYIGLDITLGAFVFGIKFIAPYFSYFWWLFYVVFALHFYVTRFGNINFTSNIDRRLAFLWVPPSHRTGAG